MSATSNQAFKFWCAPKVPRRAVVTLVTPKTVSRTFRRLPQMGEALAAPVMRVAAAQVAVVAVSVRKYSIQPSQHVRRMLVPVMQVGKIPSELDLRLQR